MLVLVAIVLAVLTFTNWGQIQRAEFATPEPPSRGSPGYDCGVPSVGPLCYSLREWVGEFDGARTSVTFRADSPGDGCIITAEWLYFHSIAQIEAGYRVCQKWGYVEWYWDATTSAGGKRVASGSQLVFRSDLGWPATIDIHRAGPQAFAVQIVAHSGPVLTGNVSGFALNPTQISIGTFLSGSNGARQVASTFAGNRYQAAGRRSWSYQTLDGVAARQPTGGPVFARWQGLPPSSSQRGGVLVTCIGQTC